MCRTPRRERWDYPGQPDDVVGRRENLALVREIGAMDRITVAKIACALAGVGLFAYGIRNEDTVIRWVGIGCVVVAFLLRFVRKPAPEE